MPGDNGLGLDDDDRLAKRLESAGEGSDEAPVEAAESGPCDATSKDDELLAENEVLGQECRAWREEGQDDGSQAVEDRGHGPVVSRRPGQGTTVSPGRARPLIASRDGVFRPTGVPKRIVYDNLKSVVLHHIGSTVQFNPRFLAFAGHYLFETTAAPVRYPQFKGRVEASIKIIRHSFFYGRSFSSLDDVRAQAATLSSDI